MKHSRHSSLHFGLLGAILMLCVSAFGNAKQKPVNNSGKADYYFLEALRQKTMGNSDAYYDIIKSAYELNPADPFLSREEGIRRLLVMDRTLMSDTLQGYISNALALVKKYVDANPDDIYGIARYAKLSGGMGRMGDAIDAWRNAYERDPNSDVAKNYIDALFGMPDSTNLANLLTLLDRIEREEGVTPEIAVRRIKVYEILQDFDNMKAEAKRLLASSPNDVSYMVYLSQLYESLNQPDSALIYLDMARETDPANGYVCYQRALYFNQLGDREAYDREVDKMMQLPDVEVDVKLEILKDYIVKLANDDMAVPVGDSTMVVEEVVGDTCINGVGLDTDSDEVIPIYEASTEDVMPAEDEMQQRQRIEYFFNTLVELYPHDASVRGMYADYLIFKKDYAAAAEQKSYQLNMDPADKDGWRTLVSLYLELDELPKAGEVALRGIKYHPEEAPLYELAAVTKMQDNKNEEAIGLLQQALTHTAESNLEQLSRIYASLGDVYYKIEQTDSVIKYYDKAILFNDKNTLALNNYAYYLACMEGGDLDKALDMIERVMLVEDTNPTSLDTYAWVLFKRNDFEKAREIIDKALSLSEQPAADLYEHAGDIYFMNRKPSEALEFWNIALKLDPDNKLLNKKVKHKTFFYE